MGTATIVVIFAIVEARLQVLLIHRSAPPEQDAWALPGGTWDGSESLGASAQRKLVQETGASDLYLEQLFTMSGLDSAQPSVAVAYFALIEASKTVGFTVPVVVRLEGTEVEEGKKILAASGAKIITADGLTDAAQKVVAASKA